MEDLYKQKCFNIIGLGMEVYNTMKNGFLEDVYHRCLEIEFKKNNISFISQPRIDIYYKGICLEKSYRPDFIIDDKLIIEIKAKSVINKNDWAQVFNYLAACQLPVGLLLNFGNPSEFHWRKFFLENHQQSNNPQNWESSPSRMND